MSLHENLKNKHVTTANILTFTESAKINGQIVASSTNHTRHITPKMTETKFKLLCKHTIVTTYVLSYSITTIIKYGKGNIHYQHGSIGRLLGLEGTPHTLEGKLHVLQGWTKNIF
jgi:hypothetical protein